MRRLFVATLAAAAVLAGAASADPAPAVSEVIKTYADIAQASYADALAGARGLKTAVDHAHQVADRRQSQGGARGLDRGARALHADRGLPLRQQDRRRLGGPRQLLAARRGPDRLRRPGATATSRRRNALYVANVIANPSIKIDGEKVDASKITKEFLSDKLQEAGGVEANVATGYHAIEFLLWGQDLQRHRAGRRQPARDRLRRRRTARAAIATAARSTCKAATDLLVADLENGRRLEGRTAPRARAVDGGRRPGRPLAHLHRPGQPLLRRTGRRAHEARPAAARSRGGARLLLRQHPQLALLRRRRHPERLPRQLQAHRRNGGLGPSAVRSRARQVAGGRHRHARGARRDDRDDGVRS